MNAPKCVDSLEDLGSRVQARSSRDEAPIQQRVKADAHCVRLPGGVLAPLGQPINIPGLPFVGQQMFRRKGEVGTCDGGYGLRYFCIDRAFI